MQLSLFDKLRSTTQTLVSQSMHHHHPKISWFLLLYSNCDLHCKHWHSCLCSSHCWWWHTSQQVFRFLTCNFSRTLLFHQLRRHSRTQHGSFGTLVGRSSQGSSSTVCSWRCCRMAHTHKYRSGRECTCWCRTFGRSTVFLLGGLWRVLELWLQERGKSWSDRRRTHLCNWHCEQLTWVWLLFNIKTFLSRTILCCHLDRSILNSIVKQYYQ